jgi:hypothetical protein
VVPGRADKTTALPEVRAAAESAVAGRLPAVPAIIGLPELTRPPGFPEPPRLEMPALPRPPRLEMPVLPSPPRLEVPALPGPPGLEMPALPGPPPLQVPPARLETPTLSESAAAALPRALAEAEPVAALSRVPAQSLSSASEGPAGPTRPPASPQPGPPASPGDHTTTGHARDSGSGSTPTMGTVPSSWRPDVVAALLGPPSDLTVHGRTTRYSGPPS